MLWEMHVLCYLSSLDLSLHKPYFIAEYYASVTSLDGIPQRLKQFIFRHAQPNQGSHAAFDFDFSLVLEQRSFLFFSPHDSDF